MLDRTAFLHFRKDPFTGECACRAVPYKPTHGAPRNAAPFMVLWAGRWRRVRIGGQNSLFIGDWLALVHFA